MESNLKKLLVVLSGIALVVLGALWWIQPEDTPTTTPPAVTETPETEALPFDIAPDDSARLQAPEFDNMGIRRTLSGRLLMISPDKTFIQIDAGQEGFFSVGLVAETVIRVGGVEASIDTLPPMAELTIEAIPQHAGQRYDFVAVTVEGVAETENRPGAGFFEQTQTVDLNIN